jgi:hypothetical protein
MKNRQNFTIKESISETFKKLCDETGANMSKLVENFMVDYINQNNYGKTILETLESIESIKQIAIENYQTYSKMKPELDLSRFDGDDKKSKLLSRILITINILDTDSCRIGKDIIIFINKKWSQLFDDMIINDRLMDYKVIIDDKLDDFIICMKVLTEEDKMIVKVINNAKNYGAINHTDINIENHHVGFKIKS